MSKKFDDEYLAFSRDATPDLWDRIEKNLEENPEREMPKMKKKSISNKIAYFALPIAALAIALVMIPLVMSRRNMGSDNMAMNMAVTSMYNEAGEAGEVDEKKSFDNSVDECCEAEPCEEACDEVCVESVCDENAVLIEGTISIYETDNIIYPTVELEAEGYQFVYNAMVIESVDDVLEKNIEIILYSKEELELEREKYSVLLEEKREGFLLIEIIE